MAACLAEAFLETVEYLAHLESLSITSSNTVPFNLLK